MISKLPSIIFLLLGILLPLSNFNLSAVTPGLYLTMFSSNQITMVCVVLVLLFSALGYWKLSSRNVSLKWWVFILHLAATLPYVLSMMTSFYLVPLNFMDDVEHLTITQILRPVLVWVFGTLALFVFGQILFWVYFKKNVQLKRQQNKNGF